MLARFFVHSLLSIHTGSTRMPNRTSDGSTSLMRNIDVMSAPSSFTHAETYGASRPGLGMLVTANVVTIPGPGSSTPSVVATPHIEHAPRGGTYTLPHFGHF